MSERPTDRPRVLLVDDDQKLANAAARVLHKHVDLDTVSDAASALAALKECADYSVLVCDHNMPVMSGADLLAKAAQDFPHTTRIMFTGDTDRAVATLAVNSAQVFRLLTKPCPPEDLRQAIADGHKHHKLVTAERELLERTLSGSVKVLVDVLALSHPRAFAASQRTRDWARTMVRHLKWSGGWEIGLAAMLWPLGDVALPEDLIRRRDAGEVLSAADEDTLSSGPDTAHALIANIPRLSGVAEIIRRCRQGYDGSGPPGDGLAGTDLPKGARLLRVLIDLAANAPPNDPDGIGDGRTVLMASPHLYDPEIVAALGCLDTSGRAVKQRSEQSVSPAFLLNGDIIARDVTTKEGRLLLAAGSELTGAMIQKLRQIGQSGGLCPEMHVYRGT